MKVVNLTRSVAVSTATDAAGTLTIVTSGVHSLVTGDIISFNQNDNKRFVVTVTNTTTFTIPTDYTVGTGTAYLPSGFIYPLALVAAPTNTEKYSNSSSADSTITFQAVGKTSSGAGTGTVAVEVSNNGVDWLTFGTINISFSTTSGTDGLVIDAPWGYVRAKCTNIGGTNARINVLMGKN